MTASVVKLMINFVKLMITFLLMIFIVFWLGSILRCEYLTLRYSAQFPIPREIASMFSEKYSVKVLEYSDDYATIYYISDNEANGNIVTFTKFGNRWWFQHWDTIWSTTGSADDFVWPYIR